MVKKIPFVSFLLLVLVGCSPTKKMVASNYDFDVVNKARSYIGTPYKYAGQSSKGMDCSGLTSVVFAGSKVDLFRRAADQAKQGRGIKRESAKAGDLVFFKKKGSIFHVGIVSKTSNNQLWMIHSSSSKGVVEQEVLSNSYWSPKLYIIRRVL